MDEDKRIDWAHVVLAIVFAVSIVFAGYFWYLGQATRANTIMLLILFIVVLRASTGHRRRK